MRECCGMRHIQASKSSSIFINACRTPSGSIKASGFTDFLHSNNPQYSVISTKTKKQTICNSKSFLLSSSPLLQLPLPFQIATLPTPTLATTAPPTATPTLASPTLATPTLVTPTLVTPTRSILPSLRLLGVLLLLSTVASALRDIFYAARAMVCPLIPLWRPSSLRVSLPTAFLVMQALIAPRSPMALNPTLALTNLSAVRTSSITSVATLLPLACESRIFVERSFVTNSFYEIIRDIEYEDGLFLIKTLFCVEFILLRSFDNFPFFFLFRTNSGL